MKSILLYGFLGRQFGRVHRYEVSSAAEAVKALSVTLQGFRKALADGGYYRVLIGGSTALEKDQLRDPVSDKETIRIVPVIQGAGGVGKVILGVVLLVVSYFVPIPGLANLGVSLIIGGVSEMLFAKKPASQSTTDRPENRPSYTFDGAVNTAAQGNPVSLLYGGPLIVGSQVVSAGLSVEQI